MAYMGKRKQEALKDLAKYRRKNRRFQQTTGVETSALQTPEQQSSKNITAIHRFSNAEKMFRKKQDKQRDKEEKLQEKKTKYEEKRKNYQQRKRDKFIKFAKKTHKGQPVMKHRIEHLLSKIQKMV